MNEKSISAPQFFSLLYLSVLGSVFMYISSPDTKIATTDSLLRPLFFSIFSIIAIIPTYFLVKSRRALKAQSGLQNRGRAVYKIAAIAYATVYLLDGIMTASRFDLFASSELFPGADMTVFIIALVAVCALLSLLGIGALSRAGVIFTVIVISATAFAMVTLAQEVDILNFTPVFENGIRDFFKEALVFSLHASSIGAVFIFSSQVKETLFKNYTLWAILGGISFSLIMFFVVGTLGVFADTQLFPTYAAISLSEFGLLERLDALETAIWILCIVSKLTFYIIIIVRSLCFAIPRLNKSYASFGVALVISLVLVFISGDIRRFGFVSNLPLIIGIYIVPVVILPLILLIDSLVQRRKHFEENH